MLNQSIMALILKISQMGVYIKDLMMGIDIWGALSVIK